VATDIDEGATVAEAVLEAVEVVADAVEGAKPPDKAGGDLLPKSRWGSRPELHSGRCRTLPHGGRQLLWYFDDSSHRDGLSEGLVGEQRRVQLEIGQVMTHHLPRFRALLARGKTPTSCLSLYYQHTVAYSAP
jgi:hypothetical protein